MNYQNGKKRCSLSHHIQAKLDRMRAAEYEREVARWDKFETQTQRADARAASLQVRLDTFAVQCSGRAQVQQL